MLESRQTTAFILLSDTDGHRIAQALRALGMHAGGRLQVWRFTVECMGRSLQLGCKGAATAQAPAGLQLAREAPSHRPSCTMQAAE